MVRLNTGAAQEGRPPAKECGTPRVSIAVGRNVGAARIGRPPTQIKHRSVAQSAKTLTMALREDGVGDARYSDHFGDVMNADDVCALQDAGGDCCGGAPGAVIDSVAAVIRTRSLASEAC